MPEKHSEIVLTSGVLNPRDPSELEARIRYYYREQRRLRDVPEPDWAAVRRIEAEMFQFQSEYSTTPAREEEYLDAVDRVTGDSWREWLRLIEEARANPCSLEDFLKELGIEL